MQDTVRYLEKVNYSFKDVLNLEIYLNQSTKPINKSTLNLSLDEKKIILKNILEDINETLNLYDWLINKLDPNLIVAPREDTKKVEQSL